MKYWLFISILILNLSCNTQPTQEVILKNLFKKEFNYELDKDAVIITLPDQSCPGCNENALQCYRKIHCSPRVIILCTDTTQIGYLSGTKRIFWDKNKVITQYQIGQQPYYIEFKQGKIISMMEFSKENYPIISEKIKNL